MSSDKRRLTLEEALIELRDRLLPITDNEPAFDCPNPKITKEGFKEWLKKMEIKQSSI